MYAWTHKILYNHISTLSMVEKNIRYTNLLVLGTCVWLETCSNVQKTIEMMYYQELV